MLMDSHVLRSPALQGPSDNMRIKPKGLFYLIYVFVK